MFTYALRNLSAVGISGATVFGPPYQIITDSNEAELKTQFQSLAAAQSCAERESRMDAFNAYSGQFVPPATFDEFPQVAALTDQSLSPVASGSFNVVGSAGDTNGAFSVSFSNGANTYTVSVQITDGSAALVETGSPISGPIITGIAFGFFTGTVPASVEVGLEPYPIAYFDKPEAYAFLFPECFVNPPSPAAKTPQIFSIQNTILGIGKKNCCC